MTPTSLMLAADNALAFQPRRRSSTTSTPRRASASAAPEPACAGDRDRRSSRGSSLPSPHHHHDLVAAAGRAEAKADVAAGSSACIRSLSATQRQVGLAASTAISTRLRPTPVTWRLGLSTSCNPSTPVTTALSYVLQRCISSSRPDLAHDCCGGTPPYLFQGPRWPLRSPSGTPHGDRQRRTISDTEADRTCCLAGRGPAGVELLPLSLLESGLLPLAKAVEGELMAVAGDVDVRQGLG